MNALELLAAGLAALLAFAVPLVYMMRVEDGARKRLDARLETLNPPAVASTGLPRRGRPQGVMVSGPHQMRIALARADLQVPRDRLLIGGAVLLVVCAMLGWRVAWWAGVGLALSVIGVALLLLRRLASARLEDFVEGLPFFLDATRQLLAVGNSFQQALVKAGENAGSGVRRYLQPSLRRIQNGAPVEDSLTWLAERLDVVELHMFAAAVQTNMRYGGRMTAVLGNLTQILRDRSRTARELRAATAETRMSGMVLSLMPLAVGGFIGLTNRSFLNYFFETTSGWHMLEVAVGLEVIGVFLMRRIMRLNF